MRPQVLGQDHGAGPHVQAVLRVQHLQVTGRGAVPGSRELPLIPVPRLPPVPRARPRPAPPAPPRSGTAAPTAAAAPPRANRGQTRIGARPCRPIGASPGRDVSGAPPRALMALSRSPRRGLPPGPRLSRAALTHAAALAGRGGRLRGLLPGERRKPGATRSGRHCQGSSKRGARERQRRRWSRPHRSSAPVAPGAAAELRGPERPRCPRAARAALLQHGGAGAPLPRPRPISAEAWRKPGSSRPMGARRGRGRGDSGGTG